MNSVLSYALRVGLCVACLGLVACEAPTGSTTTTATQKLETGQSPTLMHAISSPMEGIHGELRAQLQPVMPNSDAPRILVLEDGIPQLGVEAGTPILDAQFVQDGVLLLGADNVLRHHTTKGVRNLDTMVHAPVSVAAGRVAYVKGGIPDQTLHWLQLKDGTPEALAPEVRSWSPALSADGEEVMFVATVRGMPQLLHRDKQGVIYEVQWTGRTPSSPVAPQWRGKHLVFNDEMGVAVLDLEAGKLLAEYPKAKLLPDGREDKLWVSVDGHREELQLKEVAQ